MRSSERQAGHASIEVLSGSRAGESIALSGTSFTIGRDPGSDLRFDPERDLAVSSRHARLRFHGGRWILEDLGSLNGTFVDGQPIHGATPLRHDARIQFGVGGPLAVFRAESQQWAAAAPTGAMVHRRLPVLMGLFVALAVAAGLVVGSWSKDRRQAERVRAMQAQIDSILLASGETLDVLEGRNQALTDALDRSRADIRNLRSQLDTAQRRGGSDEIEVLKVQLQEAQVALVRQQLAAAIDYEAIEAANGRAVAKVFVDFGGEVVTATAFAARPDGLLLTSRHVVGGASGSRRPERIAVQFADSRQVWPARVVAASLGHDVAALKVDNIVGDVPTVSGLNARLDTLGSGQAVVIIGFPLGGSDPLGEAKGGFARTTLTAGILGRVSDSRVEVNGYGVEGSSGSPIFDSSGAVIGVLYGGKVEAGERTLYAVPAARALELLTRLP